MLHVIEACESSISREVSFNNLIHTGYRSSDDYIMYLKCYNASLQQLTTEAKPHTKLTDYRDRSRQCTFGKSIILTKYADTITTSIAAISPLVS